MTCPACRSLCGISQCNHCRREHPNAQTVLRNAIVATMRETGVTAAQAETAHGVTAGPVAR